MPSITIIFIYLVVILSIYSNFTKHFLRNTQSYQDSWVAHKFFSPVTIVLFMKYMIPLAMLSYITLLIGIDLPVKQTHNLFYTCYC